MAGTENCQFNRLSRFVFLFLCNSVCSSIKCVFINLTGRLKVVLVLGAQLFVISSVLAG